MKRADHHLIQRILDGDVSEEEFDRFQQRLREEPDLAKLYGNYSLLHHTLSEEFEDGHESASAPFDPGHRLLGNPWLLAFVAVLTCLVALWVFHPWTGGDPVKDVAVVTFSEDSVWRIEGSRRDLGGATVVSPGCSLHLPQGRSAISFGPSVTALIEGPAEVIFLSKAELRLNRGRGYFHCGGTVGGLTVSTPRATLVDSVAEFGIEVPAAGPDELFVADGKLRIASKGENETVLLAAGDAVRVPASGPIERFSPDNWPFAKHLGHFRSVVSGPFEKAQWQLGYGNPDITEARIDGMNYSMFRHLSVPEPAPGAGVLLATLDVGKPSRGEFHTDGWAGMSFFSKGVEMLFFGDSFGNKPTWSLDVKQRIPVIQPEVPLIGPRMVTLRYDPRSGDVSLHEGGPPLKAAFCAGKIPPGTRFDEIRLGASSGAALAVKSLEIRVGED